MTPPSDDVALIERLSDVLDIIAACEHLQANTDEHHAYYADRHAAVEEAIEALTRTDPQAAGLSSEDRLLLIHAATLLTLKEPSLADAIIALKVRLQNTPASQAADWRPRFVMCDYCGNSFDEGEWEAATECPECEQTKRARVVRPASQAADPDVVEAIREALGGLSALEEQRVRAAIAAVGNSSSSGLGGNSGSRPSDRAPTGLAASRFDPGRKEGGQ